MSHCKSYHIFLFPFKWETYSRSAKRKSLPLKKRARLELAEKCIDPQYWSTWKFEPVVTADGINTYNEYAYFYDYTRDVLNIDHKDTDKTVNQLQYNYSGLSSDSIYAIKTKNRTYELKLCEITLTLYENGIGILSFHLENNRYEEVDDILAINDFGRRLYPQFLGTDAQQFTQPTKGAFLAQQLALQHVATPFGTQITEDFSHYDHVANLVEAPFVLPRTVSALLGPDFASPYEPSLKQGMVVLRPVIDDRMFVICHYYNDQLAKEICTANGKGEMSDLWYCLAFIDGSKDPTCQNEDMKEALLKQATYPRWTNYSTIYAITRYSFILLTPDNFTTRNVLGNHVKSMYFQMVSLALLQRACIINFGAEIARIAEQPSEKRGPGSLEKAEINSLYLQYIKFVNRIFFREVTPQEQGIELYQKLQEQMQLRADVEDLNREIEELNAYAQSQQDSQLTFIAGRFLPPTLVAAFFSISMMSEVPVWLPPIAVAASFLLANTFINLIKSMRI